MTQYQNETLNEREKTHGDYADTAAIAQGLKGVIRNYRGQNNRTWTAVQMESMDLICTKIARIVSGDPNHKDAWTDLAGYADLVSERLK